MLKKNKIKILLATFLSLQIFCLGINAMENNKNSITVNNLATLNITNKSSQDKNKDTKNQKNDIFKLKESNNLKKSNSVKIKSNKRKKFNNFNLKKSTSVENLENKNLTLNKPKKETEKLFKIPKLTFNINNFNVNKIKNRKPKFKLNEHNDFINRIIEKNSKEELEKTEKDQLEEFYNYFNNSFEKIRNAFKKIAYISYRYREKPEKNINKYKQEIYTDYIENIIENHMNEACKKIDQVGHWCVFDDAVRYAKKLHKNNIFDIDKQIATIEKNVGLLLNEIKLLENKYKEYLNFIKNIKDIKLLNYDFVKDNKNKKILTNNYKYMKDVFNIQNTVNEIKKSLRKILGSIKLSSTETRPQIFKENLNFVDTLLNSKNNINTSISNKIEEEIDVLKKIIYYFVKIIEDRVVVTIQDRILGLVDEENKTIEKIHPGIFRRLKEEKESLE